MKVGDIITAYHAGFHRLDKIEKRYIDERMSQYDIYKDKKIGDEYSPLFRYTTIADSNGKPKKGSKACDAGFCRLATISIDEEIKALTERIDKLKEFKESLS